MCTAQPEIDEHFVPRDNYCTGGFRGYDRLKVEQVNQARFDELRLREWRNYPQDRFVGEKHSPPRHSFHVAGEVQVLQEADKVGLEALCR